MIKGSNNTQFVTNNVWMKDHRQLLQLTGSCFYYRDFFSNLLNFLILKAIILKVSSKWLSHKEGELRRRLQECTFCPSTYLPTMKSSWIVYSYLYFKSSSLEEYFLFYTDNTWVIFCRTQEGPALLRLSRSCSSVCPSVRTSLRTSPFG